MLQCFFKVMSRENWSRSKVMFSVGPWTLFLKDLEYCKKSFAASEPNLLVVCEWIGEELKQVHHLMYVHFLAPIGATLKIVQHIKWQYLLQAPIEGKKNTIKRYTLQYLVPLLLLALMPCFYTLVSPTHHFNTSPVLHTLTIIWAHVAAKRFLQN
jgi:hypothetical protein